MVPIFPPWKKSTLSTLLAYRAPAVRREARVAAVCGFLPRLRVCARRNGKSQRCANVRTMQKTQAQYAKPTKRSPAAARENPPVREEPASHLASRRNAGPCQMPICRQKPIPTFYERREYAEKQTIQYPDFRTGFERNTPKSGTGTNDPERLCDRLLPWKTYRHS